ncbi:response regulator transcription factor [Pseudorhodoplanes sp.]|uniref:response regulator transcription factor n=1 Tax=Pseudorhodoplanes sp. TaxID=1934341 RepID=UPI002C87E5D1|nr:response regulator transcription factor [Pseudorhodoplanes sp.]HWV53960.1 response regulator transcription factor [Pseudorhodoplanes sp.]
MAHLLCIEDDPDTCELLVEVLTAEGFGVSTVLSGEAGLSALDKRPDLVLCDIDLPDVSGFEILTKIRADNLLPIGVPFIFLTAYSQRAHQLQARQLGCDDYVTKPIDFELLIAIIRHRLASATDKGTEKSELRLTDREGQVLTWVARGKSSSDIATILGISERTVNFHLDNAMRKAGVATRVQAAVKCAMLGLIEP